MYIILVYDVNQKRVGKMLKLCRRYLTWIQNSVFEGELTPSRLAALRAEVDALLDPDEDSVIVFRSREPRWLDKDIWGLERGETDVFL